MECASRGCASSNGWKSRTLRRDPTFRAQQIFRALADIHPTMDLMTGYEELLEATIQHLEELKGRGVRFVSASPEALSALANSKVQRVGFTTQKPATPEIKDAKLEIG